MNTEPAALAAVKSAKVTDKNRGWRLAAHELNENYEPMIDKGKQVDENHRKVEAIFNQVIDHSDQDTRRILDELCGCDTTLRTDVQRLLSISDESLGDFMQGPESSLSENSDITGYKIIKQIGEGGMGSVFLAEQENPRRMVALKTLRSGFASAEMRQRFEYEAHVLGKLQHPGIAQIYQAGSTVVRNPAGLEFDQPYFAMEFVDGCTLTGYAARQNLSIGDKLRLVIDVCDAVQSAHQHGVIHRDLKPANILVDGKGQIKILDFGVARLLEGEAADNVVSTQTGQLIGTLAYMSPEQMTGQSSNVDTRSDVYSIGVLLYELLTEHNPYDLAELSIPDAVVKIRNEPPIRISHYDSKLRGDIETIVEKAIEKDKARRYQSVSDLAADIDRFLNHLPIQSRPVSPAEKTWLWCRRRPMVASLCAALAMSIVAGLAGIIWQWQEAKTQAAFAELKHKQSQENYQQAKQAIDNLTELSLRLSAVSGARDIRTEALGEVLAFYSNSTTSVKDDESSQFEVANTLYRMAEIRFGLLDITAAISDCQVAINEYEKLASEYPDDDRYQHCLAISHGFLAGAYSEGGDYEKATENHFAESKIYQRLRARNPDSVWTIGYANSLSSLARSWNLRGDPDKAAKINQSAIDTYESYDDETSQSWLYNYSLALECQSDLLMAKNETDDAVSLLVKAVELNQMAVSDVVPVEYHHEDLNIVRLRTNLAIALFQQDRDSNGWENEFAIARRLIHPLWEARPDQVPIGTSYAWILQLSAHRQWLVGNKGKAEGEYRKAIEILDDILSRFSRQDVAVSQICRILATCPIEQLRNVERAREICNSAAEIMPDSRNISNTMKLLNSIEEKVVADSPPPTGPSNTSKPK